VYRQKKSPITQLNRSNPTHSPEQIEHSQFTPPTLNLIMIACYVMHAHNISKTDRHVNILVW